MKILWIATKIPWPTVDGGRLLLANTLRALAAEGCEITLVAPDLGDPAGALRAVEELAPCCRLVPVAARLRPRAADAVLALLRGWPWTVLRHTLPAMRRRVAGVLRSERFDVVHAEPVQALGSLPWSQDTGSGRPGSGRPAVVWRAQNVDSDLWAAAAGSRSGPLRALLRLEARRLAAWEGRAVRRSPATVALTAEDAARLAAVSGAGEKIHRVAAPFTAELPAAADELPGSPVVSVLAGGGWLPNRRGAAWLAVEVWPRLRERLARAELHLFGPRPPAVAGSRLGELGITVHPPPCDSREAFPAGGVLAVPLDIASGVRMKILEAWARGVPVVATSAAARGLGAESGRELLMADAAEDFAAAIRRLHEQPELRSALVAAGRERLRRAHSFEHTARRLREVYGTVAKSG